MGKKILVTGGAGFIGTNFVAQMVAKRHHVTVFDKLTYAGGQDNLTDLGETTQLIIGDICDRDAVDQVVVGQDWLVHFAAESHNTRSETNPGLFYTTNVTGTRTLLEAARAAKISRFIHVSTDEVYGSREDGYFIENDKGPGDNQATSAYSKSKALADDLAMDAGRAGQPVIVVRPTNNFGPWAFPEKALSRWITNLLLGQKIPVWGEGLQIRDWLFAPTTAVAIEFLLDKGVVGEAYNLAANHQPEVTNRQAATWLCQILDKNPDQWLDFVPDPRPNHDFRYALDTTKIRRLGWHQTINLLQEFRTTVAWYQNHRPWWEARKAEAERIYQ